MHPASKEELRRVLSEGWRTVLKEITKRFQAVLKNKGSHIKYDFKYIK